MPLFNAREPLSLTHFVVEFFAVLCRIIEAEEMMVQMYAQAIERVVFILTSWASCTGTADQWVGVDMVKQSPVVRPTMYRLRLEVACITRKHRNGLFLAQE